MVFFSTVASVLRCGVVVVTLFVLVVDYVAHVRHATVQLTFTLFFPVLKTRWSLWFDRKCFLILATLVWTVRRDDVSFSFRGCGCIFVAVVKAFVESIQ